MAVEAVASMVIQKVTDLLIQESIIFDKVIDQVEDIRQELRQMRGILMDAEDYQENDQETKEWIEEYLETLYRVEDKVESFVLGLAHKKREMGYLKNYGLFFHDWSAYKNLHRKLKQIEGKIKELNERKPSYVQRVNLQGSSSPLHHEETQLAFDQNNYNTHQESFGETSPRTSSCRQTKRITSSIVVKEDSNFVGFKDNMKELQKRLTGEHREIIAVYGPEGSGKSTLVKRIYNSKSNKVEFDYCAWLDVSEEHSFKDLYLRVWNQVNKTKNPELANLDEDQLKDNVTEFLRGKKYLLVLDDAREHPVAWSTVIDSFPNMNDGSKVVLITRKQDIAKSWDGEHQPVCLKPLDNSDSWKLFVRNLSPEEDSELFPGYTTLQQQILKKCQGLPLALVLLGGLLSTKNMSYREWKQILGKANWHGTKIWLLCYNDLPAHNKICLLYLTLFPKEFDVSVRRIIRLWLAEGFIKSSSQLSENLAEECFNNLVKRNLITVSKFRSDGGPRKCRLPGFLHEYLSPKAREIRLFHIHHKPIDLSNLPESGVRRIVEYADIKDYSTGSNSNSIHVNNLRSYLSFNFQRYDTPAKEVGNFLSRIIGRKGFGLLRVLDLEGVYKPTLPLTLKHLLQLRYLGLRWTFLDTLPESVGDLPYLETLDLKRTYINNLPSSVWKLKHLRHVNLPEVRLDMRGQQPSSKLLTLWGLVIDNGCNLRDGLNVLDDLRELGITCQLEEFENLMSWITNLTHLSSLSLKSKDKLGRPSNLNLEPLTELHKLSHIRLLGKLSHLLTKDQFPPNLKALTLSVSHLNEDPMEILSQLPCLVVLRLLAKSYLGQEMHCPQNGFRKLRVLKLWMLNELKKWNVQKGGMSNIQTINIRCCDKLKEFPLELLQQDTLEEVILTNMPLEFQQSVKENKSWITNLTIKKYNFSPLPWDKDADLWQ